MGVSVILSHLGGQIPKKHRKRGINKHFKAKFEKY